MIPAVLSRITGKPVKGLIKLSQTAQGIGMRFTSLLRTIWLGVAGGFIMVHFSRDLNGSAEDASTNRSSVRCLPACLLDTGDQTAAGQVAETNSADAELAIHRPCP